MGSFNPHDPLLGFFVTVLGLIVGSFLNVCIYRMPREESVVSPPSHCPGCGKPVAWYDNIPLISFLALRGRCRGCKQKISPRYFWTELFCGTLWFFLWQHFGISPMLAAGAVLYSILLAITFTDFETGLIPDELSLGGMVFGLIFSALMPSIHGEQIWYWGLLQSVLGIIAGGGILYLMAMIGDLIFKKESMGGGDIKLLAMIGAFLGWKNSIFIFFMAPLPALPLGLYMKYIKKVETIPYGPFIAVTAALFFIWGQKITGYFGF